MIEKLKQRWGLKTNWDVFAVLLVFATNGTLAVRIRKPLFNFFDISTETLGWKYYVIKIVVIFTIYQLTFPIVGWLFGQFNFAWNFEKKMLKRLGLGFLFKENTPE